LKDRCSEWEQVEGPSEPKGTAEPRSCWKMSLRRRPLWWFVLVVDSDGQGLIYKRVRMYILVRETVDLDENRVKK
jgi:hypothetical protein